MLTVSKGIRVDNRTLTIDMSESVAEVFSSAVKAIKSGETLSVRQLYVLTKLSEKLDIIER